MNKKREEHLLNMLDEIQYIRAGVRMREEREEYLRQERIAVGRICRCGTCLCCEELAKTKETNHD